MNIRPSHLLLLAALLGTTTFSPLLAADQRPKAIDQPAPLYPYELLQQGLEGAVMVSYHVTSQGEVADIAVISSTNRVFELPTVRAIKRWKFTPVTNDRVAGSTPVCQLFTFVLSNHDPETASASLVAKLQPRRSKDTVPGTWQPDPTAPAVRVTRIEMNHSSLVH